MNNFEGFILAGGASSRMGKDKFNLKLGGKTFLKRAATTLSELQPQRIFLVGDFSIELPDFPVLPDVFKSERRAALIGLHTALFSAQTEWLAVLACDLPFASGELFQKLATFADSEFDAVVPLQKDEKAQPLCALYRKICLPKVEETLDGGDWSFKNLLRNIETRFVEYSNFADLPNAENLFFNVNTPEDFAGAREIEKSL